MPGCVAQRPCDAKAQYNRYGRRRKWAASGLDIHQQEARMSQKTLGYVLLVVGVVVLAVAVFADALGFGGAAGFGWKQIVGSLAGVVVGAVGGWLSMRKAA